MVTRPQFKNSLKTLSTIKGGKMTEEQKNALDSVMYYVHDSFPNNDDEAFLYSRVNDKDSTFLAIRNGGPDATRSMIYNNMVGSEDYLVQTMNCIMIASHSHETIREMIYYLAKKIEKQTAKEV